MKEDDWLSRLRELRAERGTAELADELGIPQPSLRRIISTGRAGNYLESIRDLLSGAQPEDYEGDEDDEELAELWGVGAEDVEALRDALDLDDFDAMTHAELREYIDDLFDQLTADGWDLDVSDLWDMYYGYAPGGGKAA